MIFTKVESAVINNGVGVFHLVNWVTELIEKVAGDAIVVKAGSAASLGSSRGVNNAAPSSPEETVSGKLPFSMVNVGISRSGEGASALPNFSVVVDLTLVRDKGRIKELVRRTREIVVEGGTSANVGV